MGVKSTELRRGDVIQKDGELLVVTDYEHITPGNWRAIIQIKVRNLKTGSTGQIRTGSSEVFEVAYLDRKKCQYLYRESNGDFVFMDNETFEQFHLPADLVEEKMGYVRENTNAEVTFHEGRPIGIAIPSSVALKVIESEAAVKGNTATNVKKEAVVETGLKVKVPLHIKVGDEILINTDTGEFQRRVNA
jgi:elongation factor P